MSDAGSMDGTSGAAGVSGAADVRATSATRDMNDVPSPGARRPENRLPRPEGELERLRAAWEPPKGWAVIGSVNNVFIGKLYIATAFVFLLLGGVLALLMRAQLATPGRRCSARRSSSSCSRCTAR